MSGDASGHAQVHSSQALSFTRPRVLLARQRTETCSSLRRIGTFVGPAARGAHGYLQGHAAAALQAALTYIGAHELLAIIRQTDVIKGTDQPSSAQGSTGGYVGSGLVSRPPRAAGNLVKAGEIGNPARPVTRRLRSIDSRTNATSLTGLRGDTIGGTPLPEISYLPST